jgi:hypothetical protein
LNEVDVLTVQEVNIEILNWPWPPWVADLGGVKRTGRGESIGAVIHICMGTTQGNSLCSYFYLKLAKHHISHFIFYVFSSQNRRTGRQNRFCLGEEGLVGTSGREEVAGGKG